MNATWKCMSHVPVSYKISSPYCYSSSSLSFFPAKYVLLVKEYIVYPAPVFLEPRPWKIAYDNNGKERLIFCWLELLYFLLSLGSIPCSTHPEFTIHHFVDMLIRHQPSHWLSRQRTIIRFHPHLNTWNQKGQKQIEYYIFVLWNVTIIISFISLMRLGDQEYRY